MVENERQEEQEDMSAAFFLHRNFKKSRVHGVVRAYEHAFTLCGRKLIMSYVRVRSMYEYSRRSMCGTS